MGTTNTEGRIDAIIKKTAAPEFQDNIDVEKAGVLLSIPSLLANGLLSKKHIFNFTEKYYSLPSIFITLALVFLLRIKSIEIE